LRLVGDHWSSVGFFKLDVEKGKGGRGRKSECSICLFLPLQFHLLTLVSHLFPLTSFLSPLSCYLCGAETKMVQVKNALITALQLKGTPLGEKRREEMGCDGIGGDGVERDGRRWDGTG
jgi:hypothetical protein